MFWLRNEKKIVMHWPGDTSLFHVYGGLIFIIFTLFWWEDGQLFYLIFSDQMGGGYFNASGKI